MRATVIALAFVLAVALAGLARSWHTGRVDAAVNSATASLQREAELRDVAALQWETQLAEQTLRTLQCQGQWRDVQQQNAELRAEKALADAKHEAERRAWAQRWAQRPQICDDALVEMERQCEPELGRIE